MIKEYGAFRRISTVVEAADDYNLVSLEALKADLGITVGTDDDYLTRAIERASSAAALYCNRVFVAETVRDDFEFHGSTAVLYAGRFPITSITSLVQDGVTLVEGSDYRIDADRGQIYRIDGRWSGSDVRLIYVAGYDPVPIDLQGVATEMVKAAQFNRSRDPALRSENILSGLYAYTLFDPSKGVQPGSPTQFSVALDYYRLPALA